MTIESIIERRLTEAREELKQLSHYRYALVNDVLDQAATELRAIVFSERVVASGERSQADDLDATTAATCRTSTPSPRLEAALATFRNS
jgi:guanylate kinase